MKRLFVCVILAVGILAVVGCAQSTQEQRLSELNEVKTKYLPPDAKNVKDIGNRWFTFEMEDQQSAGKRVNHRYLYRFWFGSHGEIGHTLTRLD